MSLPVQACRWACAAMAPLVGCGPPPAAPPLPSRVPPPQAAPPPTAAAPAFPVPPGQPAYVAVVSRRQQLRIYLPDRAGWHQQQGRSSFLTLLHPATESALVVRAWHTADNMNRARCEARARLARELPARARAIDSARLDVPPGFDTVVDSGLADRPAGQPVAGYLLAFGASAKRCLALAFTTEAVGRGAERLVGERLAVARSLIVDKLELLSDIPR